MKDNPVSSLSVRAGDWLNLARQPVDKDSAAPDSLDLQVLLAHVLGKTRSWVLAHPEAKLESGQVEQLNDLLARLAKGVPLPYLIGRQEFFGLEFKVNPAVLIPRPETELLVENALAWLQRRPDRRLAADVGSGSGCITVSLAKYVPDLRVIAVDSSRQALNVARQNAVRHQVDRQIHFVQGDLLSAARGPFDLVCANLPYIPIGALKTAAVARYEPHQALDGGPDGLYFIRHLIADAPRWLAPGGLMLLEMQFDQGESISRLAQIYLSGAQVKVLPDLAGLPRLVEIHQPQAEK